MVGFTLISKKNFFKHQKYLGLIDKKLMKKVSKEIKFVLQLDN
ncbi:MAG: hypothetical protein NY202_05235 [Mollicutes bacterium UO1]